MVFKLIVCKRHASKKKPHALIAMTFAFFFSIFAGATQGVVTFGLGCIWCDVFNLCCVHHDAAN